VIDALKAFEKHLKKGAVADKYMGAGSMEDLVGAGVSSSDALDRSVRSTTSDEYDNTDSVYEV